MHLSLQWRMMMNRRYIVTLTAFALCATVVLAGDLKSGPPVGKGVSSFYPFNVFNAESANLSGKENCLV